MNHIWPMVVAAMIANILSGVFFVGLFRASKITGRPDRATVLCLVIPLIVLGIGFALYAHPKTPAGWSVVKISE